MLPLPPRSTLFPYTTLFRSRTCVIEAIKSEIPLAALSASISYYDLCKSSWLPVNLIQAQRDYFGSHGYERTDRPGTFHTGWKSDVTCSFTITPVYNRNHLSCCNDVSNREKI